VIRFRWLPASVWFSRSEKTRFGASLVPTAMSKINIITVMINDYYNYHRQCEQTTQGATMRSKAYKVKNSTIINAQHFK